MNLVHQWAKAIVEANQGLALRPNALRTLQFLRLSDAVPLTEGPSDASRMYDAALLACHALDFDTADAKRVAAAWRAQYVRQSHFNPEQWPVRAEDYGLSPWSKNEASVPCPQHMGLYAVVPDASWVKRMAQAGVPAVQLRYQSDDPFRAKHEVFAAVDAVRGTHTLLFINNLWEAAIAAGAYGVHLGQEDLNHSNLDALRKADLRLGISARSYDHIFRAHACRASYIALGPVFPVPNQRPSTKVQGIMRLIRYAALLKDYPTVAFGGIRLERIPEILSCGVGTVATMHGFLDATEPEEQALQYLKVTKAFQAHI